MQTDDRPSSSGAGGADACAAGVHASSSGGGGSGGGGFSGGHTEAELLARVQCSAAEMKTALADCKALCIGTGCKQPDPRSRITCHALRVLAAGSATASIVVSLPGHP